MRAEPCWLVRSWLITDKNAAITQIVQPKLHSVLITPNRDASWSLLVSGHQGGDIFILGSQFKPWIWNLNLYDLQLKYLCKSDLLIKFAIEPRQSHTYIPLVYSATVTITYVLCKCKHVCPSINNFSRASCCHDMSVPVLCQCQKPHLFFESLAISTN